MAVLEPERVLVPSITITIPGEPAPWQVYTKQGQPPIGFLNFKAWQEQIQAHVRQQWGRRPVSTGEVIVHTSFYRGWPKTAPQKQWPAQVKWATKHIIKTPDVGNYRKAFLDALQGIVYVNDSQVIAGVESKGYAIAPAEYTTFAEGYTIAIITVTEA
jgi:Holliday junction resolvase RusA-like endonuclease